MTDTEVSAVSLGLSVVSLVVAVVVLHRGRDARDPYLPERPITMPSWSDVLPNPFALVTSRRFAKLVLRTYAKRSRYWKPARRYLQLRARRAR